MKLETLDQKLQRKYPKLSKKERMLALLLADAQHRSQIGRANGITATLETLHPRKAAVISDAAYFIREYKIASGAWS
jgi:hypothetical protein